MLYLRSNYRIREKLNFTFFPDKYNLAPPLRDKSIDKNVYRINTEANV